MTIILACSSFQQIEQPVEAHGRAAIWSKVKVVLISKSSF
jgi:hypothetical protein